MELVLQKNNLPASIEDLSKFALIGREKLNAGRAEIRAIDKLKLANDVKEQKLQEAQNIAEIVLDAETKIGELLKEIPAEITGRPKKSEDSGVLTFTKKQQSREKTGISRKQADRFVKLAENQEIVEQVKAEAREKGEIVTRQAVLDKAKKQERQQQRADLEEKGRALTINYDLRFGDFTEVFADVKDGSIDCIITDPPYPYEYIDCWSELSKFASRVLKPHGFCIAYSGQMYLPEVMQRMSEHLDYYWCMSLYMPGGTQIVNGVNMMCRWKPILIYQNGKKCNRGAVIEDYFANDKPNQDGHDWQQGENGIAYLIEKFTNPGETIIDPFCGAGTTLKVAVTLNRHCMSAEIDEQTYNIAKARLYL
jgi:site-specific DNA-methyltransferase (adenine-specific)